MARTVVRTNKAPPSPPTYSQAVKVAGLVAAILDAAGSSLDKIASATVILLEEEDFAGMNEEWLKWFPIDPPARQGAKLPVRVPGMKVSIAVIAEA